MKKTNVIAGSVVAERSRSTVTERSRSTVTERSRNAVTERSRSALAFFGGKESALFQHGKKPLSVITIALMLFAAWSWFSCNNHPKPTRVETATFLQADSVFEPTGNARLDSLLRLAAVAKQDTVLARIYFDIGEMYLYNDFEKATTYYLKLRDLCEKLNWNEGYYLFAAGYTDILNNQGLIDSSHLSIYNDTPDALQRAMCLTNYNQALFRKRDFEKAEKCLLEAQRIFILNNM